ncbi:MAG: PepSY-like domain-containing protein [Ignavibacteria bacterium]
MKTIILVALAIFISINVNAQTVPATVSEAFNKKFPDAKNVRWNKESSNDYEASFEMNGITSSADFSKKGIWTETETSVSYDQLPQKVQDSFSSNYKGIKPKAEALIETSAGTKKYEIEYKKGSKTKEVFYDEQGNKVK